MTLMLFQTCKTFSFLLISQILKYKKHYNYIYILNIEYYNIIENVSGYVCNHGSPSGERDTASPRGRYGERLQRDSCLKIHM